MELLLNGFHLNQTWKQNAYFGARIFLNISHTFSQQKICWNDDKF